MNRSLKIVFYGTPEFATGVLKKLAESDHQVVGVVTAPDKPAGRGRQLQQSHVKTFAEKKGLNILQPTNLKSEEFIEQLKTLGADLQVVVAFRMLPERVWSMPPLGTFNLHASLLPQYRGAAPINWAIINREEKTGVTTFFIDEQIDTGAIIDQVSCNIEEEETVGTLYGKLMELGANLSLKTVNDIANGPIQTKIQKEAQDLKEAPKLNALNTTLDFNQTAGEVDAMVRGLNPFPIAKAVLIDEEHQNIKIYQTQIIRRPHKMSPGSIVVENGKIKVACATDFIDIFELQLPNKKRMKASDLLNGFQFSPNARFDKA
ncbi:methionyl-tRNA formyltransferase [Nonlabens marinus]|uniref:Methionyl-tRNA formyltransferase n=1 Tax=Nonlabens marinus S1-08 TaxID=1454201 RepID=W8VWM6_9FLAO|nr:methionyl-tRNA formyltransferase [Nonlabens marinus]BAO56468.1 methionyl-tRNA formyltransferase [Nonlabens marinus S1-08]